MARMGRGSSATPPRSLTAGLFVAWMLAFCLVPQPARAHGGVSLSEDLCMLEIGFFRAHFKVYVPERRQHEEFCEDLPVAGNTLFVMEYLHPSLDTVPIDFRIIRNVTGLGKYTKLADVQKLPNIEELTVFHKPAASQADVFTIRFNFESAGDFVGIVTVQQPETGQLYTAVFPFAVGFTGLGYGTWFLLGAVALHLQYLYMSGWFKRRRQAAAGVVPVAALILLLLTTPLVAAESLVSRGGTFQVAFSPGLDPLVINQMHDAVLLIRTPAGEPVADAQVSITGGMPLHNHGLATQPQVTRYLGDGKYQVEGLRYHMHGAWELTITIEAKGQKDTVVIPLQL